MGNPTFGARPMTNIKGKRVENMSTIEAPFGRWVPAVNLDHSPPIPLCFVCELGHKFRPAHITDGFTQLVVLDHVLDCQRLDAYDLVLAYEPGRKFMRGASWRRSAIRA